METQGKEWWNRLDFRGTVYLCSNRGKVSTENGRPLVVKLDKDGYERVRLHDITKTCKDKRTSKTLHRMIYQAFHPNTNMNGLTINHIDGNKLNNNLSNLELVTMGDNNRHAYITGLKNHKGVNHPKSRFIEEDVRKMRKMYSSGQLSQVQIANVFNTKQARISEIIRRVTWNHI